MFLIFGLALILTAIQLFRHHNEDPSVEDNVLVNLARRLLPLTTSRAARGTLSPLSALLVLAVRILLVLVVLIVLVVLDAVDRLSGDQLHTLCAALNTIGVRPIHNRNISASV